MKFNINTLILPLLILSCLLLAMCQNCQSQNRFKDACDSAMVQTDREIFGTDKPTAIDILRAINKRVKDDCDCDWMIERFEKYVAQLDSGKITARDMKSYILDMKLLIQMKRIVKDMERK